MLIIVILVIERGCVSRRTKAVPHRLAQRGALSARTWRIKPWRCGGGGLARLTLAPGSGGRQRGSRQRAVGDTSHGGRMEGVLPAPAARGLGAACKMCCPGARPLPTSENRETQAKSPLWCQNIANRPFRWLWRGHPRLLCLVPCARRHAGARATPRCAPSAGDGGCSSIIPGFAAALN